MTFNHEQASVDIPQQNQPAPRIEPDKISIESDDGTNQIPTYRQYKIRYFGLGLIIFLNFSNSLFWYGFSPIENLAEQYLQVSATAVNMLTNDIALMNFLTTIFVSWWLDRNGIRVGLITAAMLNFAAGWLRYVAVFILNISGRYALMTIGQLMAGITNTITMVITTDFAMTFFNEKSRCCINMITTISNCLGGAVANLLIPLIVQSPNDLPKSLLIFAIFGTVVAIPSFLQTARPPTPPSYTASKPLETFSVGFFKLLKNRNYWCLLIPFTVLIASFCATTSLINGILVPYGYSDFQAGSVGAIWILCSGLSALVLGTIVNRFHAYKIAMKCTCLLCGTGIFILYFIVEKENYAGIATLLAIIGAGYGVLPVGLELAVECTYPVSPNTSVSILWTIACGLGFSFTLIMDQLQYPDRQGNPPKNFKKSLLFQAIVSLSCSLIILFYTAPNLRRRADIGKSNIPKENAMVENTRSEIQQSI